MEHLISFPMLGIEMTIHRVAFTVFGKEIYWYGIILATGFLLAVLYGMRNIDSFGYNNDILFDVLFWALPSAIIGARLYYVAFEWENYKDNLLEIFAIWHGGIAIYGSIIGALTAVSIYGKRHRLNIPGMFDIASVGLLIGQFVGRWGNFVNAEAHGGETNFFLGMSIDGAAPVHPTFLYESLWNFVGFFILYYISKKAYRFRGQLFFLYLVWYGAGRAWIEGLRTDSLYIGSIRVSQMLAVATCVVGVVLLILCYRKKVETVGQLWNPHADPRPIRTKQEET